MVAEDVVELLAAGARDEAGAEAIAARLADARTLLVIASGADRPAARELAIKVEEASWLPSTMRDLETFLHGHLPATDESTGLSSSSADRDGASGSARAGPARPWPRRGCSAFERPRSSPATSTTRLEPSLTPAGRLLVEEAPSLPAPVAALLGTATPLQLLTERIARARGTNPDPIRRDDPRYAESAAAAE